MDRPLATADPQHLRISTDDLPRFWEAFERRDEGQPAFEELYLGPGSTGLRAFIAVRQPEFATLAARVVARPRYYNSIRQVTLAWHRQTAWQDAVRAGCHTDSD